MKRPDSVEVVANVPRDEVDLFLDTFKRHTVARSNIVPCTTCTVAEPHTMRYQILACASKLCERVTPGLKCSWRGRVVECSKTGETTVLECLSHASRYPNPKRDRLTTAQKVYIQEMTALRVKPSRIRNAMVQKLGIDPDDLPPLKTVQSYANYYRKTKLLNHDWYDEIVDYINAQDFSGGENDTKPFTFTVDQDSRGLPVVGIGSDADPFVVGITTKRLLSRLARPPESFVFHLDATYKLNQVGYPVLVCGISDRCRTFHLVALFVMSQQQEAQYVASLSALRRVYASVMNAPLTVRYIMGDGDDAQYNGCQRVFARDNAFIYLM